MIPGLVFLVTLSMVLGAYWLFVVKPEQQAAGIVRRRLKGTIGALGGGRVLLRQSELDLSAVKFIDALLRRFTVVATGLRKLTEQSGVPITVGALLLMSACCGMAAFLLGSLLTRTTLIGLVVAPCAAFLPFAYVQWKRTKRIEKFEEQLPEALDLLSRSLRAGHALTSGIALVGEEMSAPVGPEFQLLYERQNYGMPFPDALRDFGARIPVLDAKFFVTAVLIQREAGGNLSEILTNLSGVIRERFRVKRQVRVLSAHGRITGWVLAGLPPALATAFLVTSEQHMQTLLGDPLGRQMIVGAIVLQILGTLIIRKLVKIEY